VVLILLFFILCILWVTRDLPFGEKLGWKYLFLNSYSTDGIIYLFYKKKKGIPAILIGIVVFIIPSFNGINNESLLDWKTVHQKMPWNICFLLSGGFVLGFF
jgi:di/tricarboxylate transporter